MTNATKCPRCGAELPADAPAGICPKCLMAAGLARDTEAHAAPSQGAPTTPYHGFTRFVPPTPEALVPLFPQLEILELIGAGGMGAVYKARQPGLGRLVAVKILPPEVGADPSFAQRFMREAQALARLGHQHIVSVFDFGVAGGLYYFIMEFVDGANLRHLIKTGGLQPAEALAIVPQICEALQFAHDEGVVHRDIKPENILIDKRGRVKIADFGLARLFGAAAPEVALTGTNQVLGTLHYMAPEQLQGLRTADHRADIYSLGVVFYEMLTGELPLGRFAPPSQRVDVDVRLDEVVLRSLETMPQRRYQQVSEMKTEVEVIRSSQGRSVASAKASAADLEAVGREEQTDRNISSDVVIDSTNDADERQRASELAEKAPDWLASAALGLFGMGWVVVGMMWNFRWPGLVVAIAVMAAITYGVVRWKLVYLPKLQNELAREPRWHRATALTTSLFLFIGAMLSLIAGQVSFGDWISGVSLFAPKAFTLLDVADRDVKPVLRLAKFDGLSDEDVEFWTTGGHFNSLPWSNVVLSWFVGVWLLSCSVLALIHTRRFRYTWKHWWAPPVSVVLLCLSMLPAVYFLHLCIVGYSSTTTEPREIRCAATSDNVVAAIDRWAKRSGYVEPARHDWGINIEGKAVGRIHMRHLSPGSWFDRYRASWRYVVLQPQPQLYVTLVTRDEPAEAYVRVRLPHHQMDSPEEAIWLELLNGLEAEIRAAAKTKKG